MKKLNGKGCRNKGGRGEREFLSKLSIILADRYKLDIDLQRNLEQTRYGGADCTRLPGAAIEIKHQENLSIPSWWRQATKQAEALNAIPVLAYRQSRKPWTVLIPLYLAPNAEQHTFRRDTGLPPLSKLSLDEFAECYVKRLLTH